MTQRAHLTAETTTTTTTTTTTREPGRRHKAQTHLRPLVSLHLQLDGSTLLNAEPCFRPACGRTQQLECTRRAEDRSGQSVGQIGCQTHRSGRSVGLSPVRFTANRLTPLSSPPNGEPASSSPAARERKLTRAPDREEALSLSMRLIADSFRRPNDSGTGWLLSRRRRRVLHNQLMRTTTSESMLVMPFSCCCWPTRCRRRQGSR